MAKRKGTLGAKLAAGAVVGRGAAVPSVASGTKVAARGSSVGAPKKGYQFVQKHGPRAGQSYNIKRGQRVYETGDTATASGPKLTPVGTAGARAPRPAVLRQQEQSDIADTTMAAELYRKFLNKQRPSKVKMGLGGRMKLKTRVGRTGGVQAP
jgi:hypothetical protein